MLGGKLSDGKPILKADFNGEQLSMISTMYRDKGAAGKTSEKMSALIIKISKGEKTKSVGQINLDLSKYLDVENED